MTSWEFLIILVFRLNDWLGVRDHVRVQVE